MERWVSLYLSATYPSSLQYKKLTREKKTKQKPTFSAMMKKLLYAGLFTGAAAGAFYFRNYKEGVDKLAKAKNVLQEKDKENEKAKNAK